MFVEKKTWKREVGLAFSIESLAFGPMDRQTDRQTARLFD
jgi:hypothetical protein